MQAPTFLQRMRIGIGAILLFMVLVLGSLGLVVLLVWPWWIVGATALAAVVLALPFFVLRRWLARGREGWSPKVSYLSISAITFLSLTAVVAFPIYYLAFLVDARPTIVPLVTLTDGKKTVQFQGMQHVGSEGFYKSVVYDLREGLAGGYKLFYEGVQPAPGRDDLTTWFNGLATGGLGRDLSAFYKMLADGCGMTFQLDYFKGLTADMAAHPDRHFTADVTYLDLKNEYDRLMRTDPAFARAMELKKPSTSKPDDDARQIKFFIDLWKAGTNDQKRLLGLVCRGFFSWSFSQQQQPSQMDKLILDYRNTHLARAIVEAKDAKIWITYGARHVTGVIDLLKKLDPQWRVVSIKWSRTITNPDEHHAELK